MRRQTKAYKLISAFAALASLIGLSVVDLGVSVASAAPLSDLFDAGATVGVGGPSSVHPPNLIVYSEEVPCDPTPVAATPARRPPHRIRRRPLVHKVVLPKPAPVLHRPAIHKAKVVRRSPYRHPRRAHAALVAAPKRCVVLHSESLNAADLADALDVPAPIASLDSTPDFGMTGDRGDDSGFVCGCGGGGGGGGDNISGGGGGGGGGEPPMKKPPGPITAAPEPQTWILMILGLGLCGVALRRGRRPAPAA